MLEVCKTRFSYDEMLDIDCLLLANAVNAVNCCEGVTACRHESTGEYTLVLSRRVPPAIHLGRELDLSCREHRSAYHEYMISAGKLFVS